MSHDDLSRVEGQHSFERLLARVEKGVVVHVVRRNMPFDDLVGLVNALSRDDDQTVDRVDHDRLMSGRVTGSLDDPHTIGDAFVAPHSSNRLVGYERPLRNGITEHLRRIDLRSLRIDRDVPPMKDLVLAAMIEMKMTVDYRDDVALVDTEALQRDRYRNDVGLVQLVDEAVTGSDAGVEEDHAIRMTDDVAEHGTTSLAVSRVPNRERHRAER